MSETISVTIHLPLDELERLVDHAVNRRLSDRDGQSPPPERERGRLLTAREAAERYGRTPGWYRDHREQLGGRPIKEGKRPRIYFEERELEERLSACLSSRRSEARQAPVVEPKRRTPRHRPLGTSADLLPIKPPKRRKNADG